MGPGHLGIGFAAKTVSPELPLWAYLVGSEGLDLLSFVFLSTGMERFASYEITIEKGIETLAPGSIPWSHGLFMSVIWSILAAIGIYLITRNHKTSSVFGLVVFSHWILDFIVHPPDLPIFFEGSPLLGLGLWSSGPGLIVSFILEVVLLAWGITLFTRNKKTNRT